jgi:hypothetical protein
VDRKKFKYNVHLQGNIGNPFEEERGSYWSPDSAYAKTHENFLLEVATAVAAAKHIETNKQVKFAGLAASLIV